MKTLDANGNLLIVGSSPRFKGAPFVPIPRPPGVDWDFGQFFTTNDNGVNFVWFEYPATVKTFYQVGAITRTATVNDRFNLLFNYYGPNAHPLAWGEGWNRLWRPIVVAKFTEVQWNAFIATIP